MEERILEAAARTHAATGVPILTHSLARVRMGEQQAAVLERSGVDPGRVVIGHTDDATDIDYPLGLLDRGYLVGFDRLPNGRLPEYGTQSVEARMDMLAELAARGYADQVVMSHDDPIWAGVLTDEDQQRHIESNPDVISFIPRTILPGLRERGVSEDAIEGMTVRAPRRWLAGT
jgi:phosphotriesterase-related protein